MQKQILHVVNIYFVLPYFLGGQFKYFTKKGYGLHVICSHSPYLKDYASENNFRYKEVPIARSISIFQDLKSIIAICQYIFQNKIDIIVGHTPKGALLSMIAGFIMRVPERIYFRHGLVYETSSGLKRKLLITIDRIASFCATKIVCVSPSVLQRSIEDKLASPSKQLILGKGTCSGIDTSVKFNEDILVAEKKEQIRKELNLSSSDWVIGYCGRLVRDKGIIELVEAFDLVKNEKANCKLLLVGMFEDRDALPIEIQNRIKNDQDIIYTGFVNENQEYYYSLMDVYILPSYREGFPTSVLEASAMRKPILTTRVTGCIDSIEDKKTGLFINHDAEDIAEKLLTIYQNPSYYGKNARKFVVDNFDNFIVWKEIEKLYQ